MDNVAKLIESAVENRKRDGTFFQGSGPIETCRACFANLEPVPAVCWGQPVEGWLMPGLMAHDCENRPKTSSEVSTEVKKVADFVVLVHGIPCFITTVERERMLAAFANGARSTEIRKYIFDRVYPSLPFEEWREVEERRGRRAEAYAVAE